jgi:hypothetical protein
LVTKQINWYGVSPQQQVGASNKLFDMLYTHNKLVHICKFIDWLGAYAYLPQGDKSKQNTSRHIHRNNQPNTYTSTVLEKALQSGSLCISITTNNDIMSLTPHLI